MDIPVRSAVLGALAGKTIGRVLFNETVRRNAPHISGRVLDIAGGRSPSYLSLLPDGIELVRTDRIAAPGVVTLDMNEPLPFPDASFDAVLLFNALYAAEDPPSLAREVHRVLKPGGSWLLASPFVANEMPEPHDYLRYTAEGLERLCRGAGFSSVTITRMGERATAAVQVLHPFFLFNLIRMFVFAVALMLDTCVPASVRASHPVPIGYFARSVK